MFCMKKSIVLIKIVKPPALIMKSPYSIDIFSKALIEFSATSLYSKYCSLSQRIETPSLLTITEAVVGRISRICVKAAPA